MEGTCESRRDENGSSYSFVVMRGLTPRPNKSECYEMYHRASDLASSCEHDNEPSSSIKGGVS
jgi:hypothetical protein